MLMDIMMNKQYYLSVLIEQHKTRQDFFSLRQNKVLRKLTDDKKNFNKNSDEYDLVRPFFSLM